MEQLKSRVPAEGTELLDYFDSTYIFCLLRRRPVNRGVDLRVTRHPSQFTPLVWNAHNATMRNECRTNNICEGWNNGFGHFVGSSHPTIWRLIEALQKDCAKVHILVLQDERGMQPKKRLRAQYVELQKRLHNLCLDFVNGRKDLNQFLRGVVGNIRHGELNIV